MKKQFYMGNTIYIKNENDKIRQLISVEKGLYDSSHQNYYGKPIYTLEKPKPALSSKYGRTNSN